MMDYYGTLPPPSYREAIDKVRKQYTENIYKHHKEISEHCENDELLKNIEKIIKENLDDWDKQCLIKSFKEADILNDKKEIKYSLAGWMVFGGPDIFKQLIKNTEEYYFKIINDKKYLK